MLTISIFHRAELNIDRATSREYILLKILKLFLR